MLYIALIFVIIVLILEKIVNKNTSEEIKQNDIVSFEKKEYLMTKTELKFYKVLKEITDKLNLSIFCQVAMYEVIKSKDYKAFNKIKSKTIDFVLTEPNRKN